MNKCNMSLQLGFFMGYFISQNYIETHFNGLVLLHDIIISKLIKKRLTVLKSDQSFYVGHNMCKLALGEEMNI